MTLSITVQCDWHCCANEADLNGHDTDDVDDACEDLGWHVGRFHYCPEHAFKAKAEIEASNAT